MKDKKRASYFDTHEINEETAEVINDIPEEVVVETIPTKATMTVTAELLNVREHPMGSSRIVNVLKKGEIVEIEDSSDSDFYKIPGGYIMKQFVK